MPDRPVGVGFTGGEFWRIIEAHVGDLRIARKPRQVSWA
jgi:hypothetical protein